MPDITLGGRTFTVQPMDFNTLAAAAPLFEAQAHIFSKEGVFAKRDLILLAVKDQIAAADFMALRSDFAEMDTAVSVIAEVSGMTPLMVRLSAKIAAAQPSP